MDKVLEEVKEAYSNESPNLSFLSSQPVTRDEAIAIMEEAVPGYNDFQPELLRHLNEDSTLYIAREGSVCVYVVGEILDYETWQSVLKVSEIGEVKKVHTELMLSVYQTEKEKEPMERLGRYLDEGMEFTRLWWD
eukprot:TRINITY_DN1474_c0_g1_i1.p1 TRINITY_DN1474_c0_g1~~TRINITY_DN1474_c0_g1_i1.p1  ORF type:complete len:135 (-),score=26.44 TRINITY_DN1474_c0_g1_i1:31-435(-)